ncbi:MAG: S41 family peptidase, partial [Bacteroidota bacterium]
DSLRQSIGDNLSRMDFYRIVLQVVELTNEGHTEARLPPRTKLRLGWSKTFFPLALSHYDGKWIITQNFGAERPTLQKGQELLRLNGQSVDSLARSFFPYLASDGFNQTSKYEWVGSLNFALFYRLVYGPVDQFRLTVRAMDGPQTFTVELDPVRFTAYKKKNAKFPPRYFEYTRFTRRILNDSIAYLSVPSFGGRAQTFADYYRMAFSEIDSLGIQHLIIDIQDNGGGTEGNENLLFSYLTDQAIRKYRRVTMRQAPYLDNKDDNSFQLDRWEWRDSLAYRGEFTTSSAYLSDIGHQAPDPALRYRGKVYVLISGTTFSGGAEFASLLRMSGRGIFIGEETGGTYEGNVSGYSETIKLPHSKIRVDIPTVHFQVDVQPQRPGRGVFPDHYVPQTAADYREGTNAKLEYTLELIQGRRR